MKILIAEDDPVATMLLRRALEAFGHEVIAASNGQEAWEAFDREPVRLVVSDWLMPGLDGLGLCQKVRARPKTPYTYFILLTSQETGPENYDLATEAGVDDFLTKPLERPTIRMRLRVAERILKFTTEIRQLKDMIPICAYCRKIRNDDNYWQMVETYIGEQTGSNFTHGICPACSEKTARGDQVTAYARRSLHPASRLSTRRNFDQHHAVRRDCRAVAVRERTELLLPPKITHFLRSAHSVKHRPLHFDRRGVCAQIEKPHRPGPIIERLRVNLEFTRPVTRHLRHRSRLPAERVLVHIEHLVIRQQTKRELVEIVEIAAQQQGRGKQAPKTDMRIEFIPASNASAARRHSCPPRTYRGHFQCPGRAKGAHSSWSKPLLRIESQVSTSSPHTRQQLASGVTSAAFLNGVLFDKL